MRERESGQAVGDDLSTGQALVLALLVALLFLPGIAAHVRIAVAEPHMINDDVRQWIWPLARYSDPSLFRGDRIAAYLLDCLPIGFRALYAAVAPVADPRTVSRYLPYLLYAVVIASTAVAGHRLAGRFGALLAPAFLLGSSTLLERMTGGLPRAFAYPLLGVLVALLLLGRPVAAAVVTATAAAFYPSAALAAGVILAMWVGAPQLAWPAGRRIALIAGTAAVCVALVLPVVRSTSAYGAPIGAVDAAVYPEIGAAGRYTAEDRPPFGSPGRWFTEAATQILMTDSQLLRPAPSASLAWTLMIVVAVSALAGALLAARDDPLVRRFWILPFAAAAAYALSAALHPRLFLPTRFPAMLLPLFVPLAVATGLRHLIRNRHALLAAAIITLGCSLLAPAPPIGRAGWTTVLPESERKLAAFIATLPKDAVVAGWPGPTEPVESVPYFALRAALVTYETHHAFHREQVEEMRRRMDALIALYLDGEADAVRRLREDFGVTHVIVGDARSLDRLSYFEPFAGTIAERSRRASLSDVERALGNARTVFEIHPWRVLDLGESTSPRNQGGQSR